MIKSVLVAALSVTLISTGLGAPSKKSSRTHSKKAVSRKSHHENNRKASGKKSYDRGRRVASSKSERSSAPKHSSSKEIGRGTLTGTNINVRSAPSSDAKVVTKASGGNVAVLAQKGDWFKVRCQHGSEGWVRQDFIQVATKSSSPKVKTISLDPVPAVAAKYSGSTSGLTRYVNLQPRNVNIRKGPSTSNSIANTVHGGKALVVDKWEDWYKLKFQHGTVGWVRKDALNFPSNFDYKNSRNAPTTTVATKAPAKPKENVVEIVDSGEVVTPETVAVKTTPKDNGSEGIKAMVMGDRIDVRRGASKSNSLIMRMAGGPATIVDSHGDWKQLKFPGGTVGWVHESHVSYPGHVITEPPPTYVASNDGGKLDGLMKEAYDFKRRGVRYGYGSSSRSITDCSGFTLQAFRSIGVSLPRTAREQATRGVKVGRWELKPGDLVFFNTRGYISHVGIYIGNQHFIHASSGGGRVMESSLNETYYGKKFLFGKRIISPSQVKKLDLPKSGDLPTEQNNQRDENRVDLSGNQPEGKQEEPAKDPASTEN